MRTRGNPTHSAHVHGGAFSCHRHRLLVVAAVVLGFLCGPIRAQYPYRVNPNTGQVGNGTLAKPYIIGTPADLVGLSNTPADWDKNFRQLRDINMAGTPISPIGTSPGGDVFATGDNLGRPFTGTYDGSFTSLTGITTRCKITNLVLVGRGLPGGLGDGLFGVVAGTPGTTVIQRVTLEGPIVIGSQANVGAMVGCLQSGTVQCCAVHGGVVIGSFPPGDITGGLVGSVWAGGIVDQSWSTATVLGATDLGGLVGQSSGTVTNCWATGIITQFLGWPAPHNVGGLVGQNLAGTVQACYANSAGIFPTTVPTGTNRGSLVGLWAAPVGPWYLWPVNYSNQETPGVPAPIAPRASNGIGTGIPGGAWVDQIAVSVTPGSLTLPATFVGWFYLGSPWLMPGPARTPDLQNNPF
jgi:hypothetical protein